MKEVLDTLIPIKESTGLEIDIYSARGNLLFSTSPEKPAYFYRHHKPGDFSNGIIMDKDADITYFSVNSKDGLTGVIMGSNEVSRNYAVIVSKLIEKSLAADKVPLDKESSFRLLFLKELSKYQYEELQNSLPGGFFPAYVLKINIKPKEKLEELKLFLNAMSALADFHIKMDGENLVYIKKTDPAAYTSADDFAFNLYENAKQEIKADIKISAGSVAGSFSALQQSYDECDTALNLGSKADKQNNVYSFKQYALINMLSQLPKETLADYFNKDSLKILKDGDLLSAAEEFMNNSLNAALTCRKIFMHRNTLNNKLDKIEKATGLNLRRFNDALIFKIYIMLDRILSD